MSKNAFTAELLEVRDERREVRGERREYYRFVAIDRKQDKQHTPEREKEKQLFLFWKKV